MEKTIPNKEYVSIKKPRELGIEILRILAMFFIVCQHFLNHGGFLRNADGNKIFLNLINVLFAPSVNVFVLISGYFSANSTKFRAQKTLSLWLQVFFYSLFCIPIAMLLGVEVERKYVTDSFFPVINNKYWFFTTYFIMTFITPLLAKIVACMTKREHLTTVLGIFIVGYVSSRFKMGDVFSLNGGYGGFWFIMLFLVGAYLKKYPLKIKKVVVLCVYITTVFLQMLFKYKFNDTSKLIIKLVYGSTGYIQPLTLLASTCLLLLFLGIKNDGRWLDKVITYLSGCTFSVYLFHEEPLIRSVLYTLFQTQKYWANSVSALIVLAFSVITFMIGVVIESLRKALFFLFKKVLKKIKRQKGRE